MRLRIVKTVFNKELREMLRDRRSLAIMFGVPLVLYPVLTIVLASLGTAKVKDLRQTRYKIAIVNHADAPELLRRLSDKESGVEVREAEDPVSALRKADVEAIIEVPKDFERQLIRGQKVPLEVKVDRSRTEADFAERKLSRILEQYYSWILAQRLSVPEVAMGIEKKITDVSTAEQRMGNRLAQLIPLLVLITGMLGALFPALSATTTERELGTMETLLATPAGRMELLVAKGLLVLLCGITTALLNMLSMSLVLWRTFSIAAPDEQMAVPIGSILLSFTAAVPALIFFTTLMLIIGLLARTFREANSYVTPAMLLPIASLALTIADVKATPGLLVTPIANTTLVMRDILRGRFDVGPFMIAFTSSCVYAGLLLAVASRLFSNEQLVNPSWEPLSFKGLARGKRKDRLPALDEAIALFALALLLLFYIQPSLLRWGLLVTLAITEVCLVFGPAALWAWAAKWNWRTTFKARMPRSSHLLAAVLLGVGLVPIVTLLSGMQNKVWPRPVESAEAMAKLLVPWLENHPFLIAISIGVLAGVFEELLFRGPIQTAFERQFRPATAIIATAILFAGMHLDIHGMALRALLGSILGYLAWRTRSILPAIITHGVYDATTVLWGAWMLRRYGTTSQPPLFDGSAIIRLAIGLAVTGIGFWILTQKRTDQVAEPA